MALGKQIPKTVVMMLHHGQPRTPYYATKHLAESTHHYYNLPLWLTSTYSNILEKYLNELIPEHGPFSCTHAFLCENPTIPKTISNLISTGMQRLILLPLYPHYSCFRTGAMLNNAVKTLDEQTVPLSKDGFILMDYRLRTMSHISFRCSAIDRWSSHPAIFSFWYDLLRNELKSHDSLLFVAPQMRGYNSSGYAREVWASCQRLAELFNEAVPWKLAWFGGWDQWPATTVDSIGLQLYFMRRDRRYRTLVVPITTLIPSFETESILPMILQNEGVDLLSPPEFSPILAHGFAELIKNHLVGRQASSQLFFHCKLCFNSLCSLREAMIAPKKIPVSDLFFETKFS